VRNALPNLPVDDIKQFVKSKRVMVEGFELTDEELNAQRYFDAEAPHMKQFESGAVKDVLVLMDMELDEGLVQEGLARELMNRIIIPFYLSVCQY
jgi:isoleucyl-tRNA synthetase